MGRHFTGSVRGGASDHSDDSDYASRHWPVQTLCAVGEDRTISSSAPSGGCFQFEAKGQGEHVRSVAVPRNQSLNQLRTS